MIGSVLTGSLATGAQSVKTAGELAGSGSGNPSTPPAASELVLWLKGDRGVTHAAGLVTAWADQSGNGNDVTAPGLFEPAYDSTGIDGIPAVQFSAGSRLQNVTTNLTANGGARTVVAVVKPSSGIGGSIMTFRRNALDHWVALWTNAGQQFVWSDGFASLRNVAVVDYTNTPILVTHVQDASLALSRYVNGVPIPLNGTTVTADSGFAGFTIGNRELGGALGWIGIIPELMVWPRALTIAEMAAAGTYAEGRFPSL